MRDLALTVCLLAAVVGTGAGYRADDDEDELLQKDFKAFKDLYHKVYDNEIEERFRMMIYSDNSLRIAKHNDRYKQGLEHYRMEMNEFGDLLLQEFLKSRTGFNANKDNLNARNVTYFKSSNLTYPLSMDWRRKGAVTDVKLQGDCGCCWAFSAIGSLESQKFIATGKLVTLSEQNLVDCVGGNSCHGGTIEEAFNYINRNEGIDTQASYPYSGKQQRCRFDPATVGATCTGYERIPYQDERLLMEAVALIGPISVGIDASHDGFRFYPGGGEEVYYERTCSSTHLDHAVLVVGYGTTKSGKDFWMVKNSWGTGWGINGYAMMARNRDNNCGIASDAIFPTI